MSFLDILCPPKVSVRNARKVILGSSIESSERVFKYKNLTPAQKRQYKRMKMRQKRAGV